MTTAIVLVSLSLPTSVQAVEEHFEATMSGSTGTVQLWDVVSVNSLRTEEVLRVGDRFYRIVGLMDRYLLVVPEEDGERETLFAEFFDWIAPDYVGLIDRRRNTENIARLCQLLGDWGANTQADRILDFGCGPGLSKYVPGFGRNLVGFDASPKMREAARAAGMEVWEHRDLATLPVGAIDAVFASYVLHTRVGGGTLQLVASRMKPGAVLAANFHKNMGVEWARATFGNMGLRPVFEEPSNSNKHGTYMVFSR